MSGQIWHGAVALMAIVVLSALFRDYVLVGAALLLFVLHVFGARPALATLQDQSLNIGLFFLMVYLLLPLTSDTFDLGKVGKALISPAGLVAVIAGLAISYLGGAGMHVLSARPAVLFGVIIGTLIAVLLVGGLPAGMMIAAGVVAMLSRAIPL